jgi:hypothetical protein
MPKLHPAPPEYKTKSKVTLKPIFAFLSVDQRVVIAVRVAGLEETKLFHLLHDTGFPLIAEEFKLPRLNSVLVPTQTTLKKR